MSAKIAAARPNGTVSTITIALRTLSNWAASTSSTTRMAMANVMPTSLEVSSSVAASRRKRRSMPGGRVSSAIARISSIALRMGYPAGSGVSISTARFWPVRSSSAATPASSRVTKDDSGTSPAVRVDTNRLARSPGSSIAPAADSSITGTARSLTLSSATSKPATMARSVLAMPSTGTPRSSARRRSTRIESCGWVCWNSTSGSSNWGARRRICSWKSNAAAARSL